MLKKIFGGASHWSPLILRLAVGAVFFAHGAQKLFGIFGGSGLNGFAGMLGRMGFKPAMAWAVLVALVEFLGGIGLIFGFLTRLWALLLGIVMVVAIIGVHLHSGFFGLEFQLVLLASCLSLLLSGGGRGSIREC